MEYQYRAHDLLWIHDLQEMSGYDMFPPWVKTQWHRELPLVVRRDWSSDTRLIPIGIRGNDRNQRVASWVHKTSVKRVIPPEHLIQAPIVFTSYPVFLALKELCSISITLPWGVTGSCGYSLATGINYVRQNSDLDIVIRCEIKLTNSLLTILSDLLPYLPCRVDIQLETPYGGCSLTEWEQTKNSPKKVLLKTNRGPLLVDDPWHL
ncbi:malonate decarboxylase holo-ACP synthase [Xenorhabdus griffiniae]|uniref:Malonate decarboxylase holo-ACP synthase n=1 Tax=Xenorhabdus griffiniae TaxID=351672 RepID=A0ABY9XD72_9GAMM|nr:malonate decarboxylase holo-ACP synthase [Xenorhabdus griffiniae]MBD1228085.1 malonate decarboxylase holo-ACP synthase [Xenorhabdus griffiniae]MBE8587505.1 malonate decarboxylase holo-ACP synthase [Xenorhabdus griffiniae]WMV70861.1 malonate decarboxylase holo-ACP synthase [Xenorhabdus griffiniae]WNH00537.1 malonate decarboxylase holo-ACP synthase [Xenorhabdus griffiniae]